MSKVIKEWLQLVESDWRNPPPDYEELSITSEWETIARLCQYPVEFGEGLRSDCGEKAVSWIWWKEYSGGMYVCLKHMKEIEEDD